jgi:hypothetical protein
MTRTIPSLCLIAILGCFNSAHAQVEIPAARPIPKMQVTPLPHEEASITRDGQEISRYYFGHDLRRPFLYPIVGPSGKSLTRMGHPRDPNTHSHHNSFWVSHHDVGGVGFWNDQTKGNIVHQRVTRYEDADEEAIIEVVNLWKDGAGKPLLEELRTMRFRPLDGRQWLLVLDVQLAAPKEPITIGKTPFGIVGVRMAKLIGVHDGGGMIRNSEGGVNEEGVFWKPARWCDYSGQITPEAKEGLTLMDHPSNPNHPTVFHVRDDGWMGTCLTFDAPRTIEPGTPLKLRYGLFVHAGVPTTEQLDQQFAAFAKIGDPPPLPKKK